MKQSISFSQLERQIRAAHQLRAEMLLAGASMTFRTIARALRAIRGRWLRTTFQAPGEA